MNRLSAFSIILVFAVLAIAGAGMVPLLNLQYSPSSKEGELSVSYNWNGASAKLIESEVTSKLEGLIASVSGIKKVSSVTRKGYGSIDVVLKDKNLIEQTRFEISTLIRQTYNKLPDGISYPEISVTTGGSNIVPIITYTINSQLPTQKIEQYVQENILKELSLLEGVSSVELSGATPFYQELRFNPAQLKSLGITIDELVEAVKGCVAGYSLMGSNNGTGILLANDFEEDGLEMIPVKNIGGRIIYVGDICTLEYKEQQPSMYYRLNGLNTINIAVYSQNGANAVAACNAVKEKMAQLEEGFPSNFSALEVRDVSVEIKAEINKIVRRTALSLAILLLFVYGVSRSIKYLLAIAGALLANILISFLFYVLFGIDIHVYTLAGITTSFGIVIDTSIIMLAHYSYWRNRKVFLAILAALLTSIGSLAVIFLLPQEQQLVLRDFAAVIMVNLSVSLLIALLLIPALVDKFGVQPSKEKRTLGRARHIVQFNAIYSKYIVFASKWKWAVLAFMAGVLVLSYNYFKENSSGNFHRALERPNLYIMASLPQGCTIGQLNEIVMYMENYLSQFEEIEMFFTTITGQAGANIVVYFKEGVESTHFPLALKNEIISKAVDYGGANWGVYGIDEHGFSNTVGGARAMNGIVITGHNFDKLYDYCQYLVKELENDERVVNVHINSGSRWRGQSGIEYFIDYNATSMAMYNMSALDAFSSLQQQLCSEYAGNWYKDGVRTDVYVSSCNKDNFDVWNLKNEYVGVGENSARFSQLGVVSKRNSDMDIYKENQEYSMMVAFDYLGQVKRAEKLIDYEVDKLNASVLPVGFKARPYRIQYGSLSDVENLYMLLLVVAIIYFMCSILFESLAMPLLIIGLIPMSFIGVFLIFGFTGWTFDQGGYASLIMMSGLVVNAGIYILHEYKEMKVYVRAFNHKIIPIFLTVVSTILGLVPFLLDGTNEVFWFAFAVGTMSGLVFSLFALIFIMPVWLKPERNK